MRASNLVATLMVTATGILAVGLALSLRQADPMSGPAAATDTFGASYTPPSAASDEPRLSLPIAAPGSVATPTLAPTASTTSSGGLLALEPAVSQAPPPDCDGRLEILDRAVPDTSWIAGWSSASVLATITEVGPAQWNTANGGPPTGGEISPLLDVMRLVRLTVEDPLTGEPTPDSLVAWLPGGTIGCASFSVLGGWPLELNVGERFVFFLQDDVNPASELGVPYVFSMWPVNHDGIVDTPSEGQLSIVEVADRLQAAEQR